MGDRPLLGLCGFLVSNHPRLSMSVGCSFPRPPSTSPPRLGSDSMSHGRRATVDESLASSPTGPLLVCTRLLVLHGGRTGPPPSVRGGRRQKGSPEGYREEVGSGSFPTHRPQTETSKERRKTDIKSHMKTPVSRRMCQVKRVQ